MDLYQYLQSAQKSLFRFEALQEYIVDGDAIDDQGMKEWWNFISSKTDADVRMQRVRLVTEPTTKYTEKELVVHKKSKTFGDDIRIINEDAFQKLNIRLEDFWLIDEDIVLIMKYSTLGEYLGFDVIEDTIGNYSNQKNLLLENSVAL